MRRLSGNLLACVLAAAGTGPAFAQYIDQNRADRRAPETAQPAAPVPAPATQTAPSVTPFTLTAIQVSGASVPPALVNAAAGHFIGQRVDANAIKQITDALSQAYGKSEIALYTIVAPEQDFAGGILKLVVLEGYIEHVDLQGPGIENDDLDLVKAYAAKLMAEKPLKRSTLQRYVSLIRDIAGLKTDIQLMAGGAPGALRMVIKLDQRRYKVGLAVNNNGNPLLGRTQMEADIIGYGLLREGEQTTLSLGTATSTGRFQFVSLADAEPVGDDGTTVQGTGAYIHTKARGINLTGEAETLQFLVTHPLVRSYDENLYVSGALDGLNSTNALLGQTLANERVRAVRLAASYVLSSPDDLLSASATFSNGIDGLGARISLPGTAVPDFQKFNFNLGYNRLFWSDWVVRLKTAAQLGAERLPTSELISLGGPDYGRAFAVSSIIGDSGAAGSGEIAWHPGSFLLDALKGSEVYGFYDRGETWFRQRGSFTSGTAAITSAGGGVRLAVFENNSLGLEAARQLAVPLGFKHGWAFNLTLKTLQ